jgi:hypothetical protein
MLRLKPGPNSDDPTDEDPDALRRLLAESDEIELVNPLLRALVERYCPWLRGKLGLPKQ